MVESRTSSARNPGLRSVSDPLRLVAISGGSGLAVDALLLSENGGTALGLAAPVAPILPAALAVVGVGLIAFVLGTGLRTAGGLVRRSIPELFPFGGPALQIGIYLLIVVGAASVAHASFVVFTGADTGGPDLVPPPQTTVDALITAASLVVWGLTLYGVFGLRRFIRMGRTVDARRGVDPFGRPVEPEDRAAPPWVPLRAPAPPAPPGLSWATGLVTVALLFEISVGIQLVETPLGPAAPAAFWWSQVLTPVLAGIVAATVGSIDRGVRDLERQYGPGGAAAMRPIDPPDSPPSTGFVQ